MKKIVLIGAILIGLFLLEMAGFTFLNYMKYKKRIESGMEFAQQDTAGITGAPMDTAGLLGLDTGIVKQEEVTFQPEETLYQSSLDSELAAILEKYRDAELTLTPEQIKTFEKLDRYVQAQQQAMYDTTALDTMDTTETIESLPEEELLASDTTAADTAEVVEEEVAPAGPTPEEIQAQQRLEEERKKALRKLAKIYSEMEASKAAKILEKMETKRAVEILSNMRERSAAEILNLMDPYKVIRISKLMTEIQNGSS